MAKPFFCQSRLGICLVQKGVSVTDLSFDTRINTRDLGRYLRGQKQMSVDHLTRIAERLDVDPRQIFQPFKELADIDPHYDHDQARREVIDWGTYDGATTGAK